MSWVKTPYNYFDKVKMSFSQRWNKQSFEALSAIYIMLFFAEEIAFCNLSANISFAGNCVK
jgi:hypothetical protein